MAFQQSSVAVSKTQAVGNLFNGNEYSGRFDYNWNTSNRLSANFNYARNTDNYGPCTAACTRGFTNPEIIRSPNGQFGFVHTFTPTLLNEFRAGYTQLTTLIGTNAPGVPFVAFDDLSVGFGSYNGYPQYFKDHIYTYSDMVSISHGNHVLIRWTSPSILPRRVYAPSLRFSVTERSPKVPRPSGTWAMPALATASGPLPRS